MQETVPFRSIIYPWEAVPIGDRVESVVRAERAGMQPASAGFEGIRRIGVIGWGPQGKAQALNLRDSLEGTGIVVTVGLRKGSAAADEARAHGFTEEKGTLGELFAVVAESDLAILLISDAAQVELKERIFAALRPGATLGLSHGFLAKQLASEGEAFPPAINVVAVCPKGMGLSVRRLYTLGREIPGAGINASIAVHRDVDGRAADVAVAWALALGAPCVFATTLLSECDSDLFGERGILLGGLYGLCESLYAHFRAEGMDERAAYLSSGECITGPLSRLISQAGILALYESLRGDDRARFRRAYSAVYPVAMELLSELYDEVRSGNELRSVLLASRRLERFPLRPLAGDEMTRTADAVRADRPADLAINGTTAGAYLATMMAQVAILRAAGHPNSEIVNETVIEAVDSLNPYVHRHGIGFMIDNCSITARLGARKWGPRFAFALTHGAMPAIASGQPEDAVLLEEFQRNAMHGAIAACNERKPSVPLWE